MIKHTTNGSKSTSGSKQFRELSLNCPKGLMLRLQNYVQPGQYRSLTEVLVDFSEAVLVLAQRQPGFQMRCKAYSGRLNQKESVRSWIPVSLYRGLASAARKSHMTVADYEIHVLETAVGLRWELLHPEDMGTMRKEAFIKEVERQTSSRNRR